MDLITKANELGFKDWIKSKEIQDSFGRFQILCALQKWLREVHDIYVSINTISEFTNNASDDIGDQEYIPKHKFRIIENVDNFKYNVVDWSGSFETYEEALEVGLFEALKSI